MNKNNELESKSYVIEEKVSNNSLKNKIAYICSPLHAETDEKMQINMLAAYMYMQYASATMGYPAKAVHAFLPNILDDNNSEEREQALALGLQILDKSDILMVCGNRLSEGMKGEITQAAEKGKRIVVFNENLLSDTINFLSERRVKRAEVELDTDNELLAKPPEYFAAELEKFNALLAG